MNCGLKNSVRQAGSVLVICLILAVILGITLGSYLLWMRSQAVLSVQSHAWNTALAVAEAGIEEAMAHINTKFGTNGNFAANGWGGSAGGPYGPVSRTLLNGSSTNGWFTALIVRDATTGYPTIYSTGYTMVPLIGKTINRVVEARTATSPAFLGAIAALDDVTFNGNDVKIDSYDSLDPDHSTPTGLYDPATRKAGGDVSSNYGMVNVGNADVNGKIRTGPNGSYATGASGFAGDLNWYGPGVQPGWYANDFNADFPDASLPENFSGLNPVYMPPIGGNTNVYYLGNSDYRIKGNLVIKAGENLEVDGYARLYVTGDVQMSGTASITITPKGRLEIYVAGANASFSKVNTTGNANTFTYFGLPSNTSLSWGGNAQYVGTVYAPQATFKLGGGGNNIMDFQGAAVVKAISIHGKFNFHYDEGLNRRGPLSGFRLNSWREI
jgi:hypothetical protein